MEQTMAGEHARWIVAFDASCGTCREISDAVRTACDGRLEVLPLTDPQVQQWRVRALGPEPDWTPTLLKVADEEVRAWTGPAMGVPLARRLGARSGARVLVALGTLRRRAKARSPEAVERAGMGRARFLRLGAGLAVAGGIVATGRSPAFAHQAAERARTWAQKHPEQIPRTYAEFIRCPAAFRNAAYQQLSPAERADLWREQWRRYRAIHGDLTADQIRVLDESLAILDDASVFAAPSTAPASERPAVHERLEELRISAIRSFGRDDAHGLFASIGSQEPSASRAAAPDCECSTVSDFCVVRCVYKSCNCLEPIVGCGWLLLYKCNGMCTCP
ncbi:bacteriocin fulvocin C-related protein [Streptomyces sp. BH-SS-21]|uniref:Bacteriocin fulvocin C-related protein n=1 Tax=Streptomyces liliiviolaceus TaxID=2823109 RepID=A0A940Y918_9ACTN|nr:bacteriocin fulvocin C-related protein [Streptomyces liliiviolaceus]MBQ0854820.1 bacteriocin fulvocin C-related protein [Streptomyces liliiviolaceus]